MRELLTKPKHHPLKIIAVLVILLFLLVFFLVRPTIVILSSFGDTLEKAKVTQDTAGSFDLEGFQKSLPPLKTSLGKTNSALAALSWTRFIPFFGSYFSDFRHVGKASSSLLESAEITAASLEPHAASLGLTSKEGKQIASGERIKIISQTIEKIVPDIDKIAPKIREANREMAQVKPERYPNFWFFGKAKRGLANAKDLTAQAEFFLVEAKPLLLVLPSVMGVDSDKRYLVLFQNDKEIRPSGGFLTAYTFVTFKKGSIEATGSDDIYHLDERLHEVCLKKICPLSPPAPIVKYLPEPTGKQKTAWDSRDSNLSPDWKVSAQEFERFYNIIGGQSFDGIIAVDTFFVQNLLSITGPISVGGYPKKFDKDNVVDELLNYSEIVFAGQRGRKQVLGDLMYSIMLTIMQSDKSKFAPLIKTLLSSSNEKHILFYFKDQKAQSAFEKFNWAGRIRDYSGDFLHINDSNFAGGKANLYIQEKIEQKIQIDGDDKVTKEVKIEYRNPEKYNNRLNPIYRDWVRIYVPKGSKLISSDGSQDGVRESDDLGKTVFDGFIQVRPEGSAKLVVKYTLPFSVKRGEEYKLLIQKQPGTDGFTHQVIINGKQVEKAFPLKEDREVIVRI